MILIAFAENVPIDESIAHGGAPLLPRWDTEQAKVEVAKTFVVLVIVETEAARSDTSAEWLRQGHAVVDADTPLQNIGELYAAAALQLGRPFTSVMAHAQDRPLCTAGVVSAVGGGQEELQARRFVAEAMEVTLSEMDYFFALFVDGQLATMTILRNGSSASLTSSAVAREGGGMELESVIREGPHLLSELLERLCYLWLPHVNEDIMLLHGGRQDDERGVSDPMYSRWRRWSRHFYILVIVFEVHRPGASPWELRMQVRSQAVALVAQWAPWCNISAYVVRSSTDLGQEMLADWGWRMSYHLGDGENEVYYQILRRGNEFFWHADSSTSYSDAVPMESPENVDRVNQQFRILANRYWHPAALPCKSKGTARQASLLVERWNSEIVRESLLWYLEEVPWEFLGNATCPDMRGISLAGVSQVLILTDVFGPLDETRVPAIARGKVHLAPRLADFELILAGRASLRDALFIVFFQDDTEISSSIQQISHLYKARYDSSWLGWWNYMHGERDWLRPPPVPTLATPLVQHRSRFLHGNAATRAALAATQSQGFKSFDLDEHEALCQALFSTRDVPGAFVEFGVYRGTSAFTALSYMHHSGLDRAVWLFDTFEGFASGSGADSMWDNTHVLHATAAEWMAAVSAILARASDSARPFRLERLDVTSSAPLPASLTSVAVANVDVDSFDATLAALQRVAPLISRGGVIMCEDVVWTPWLGGALAALDAFLATDVGRDFRRWVLPTHHMLIKL